MKASKALRLEALVDFDDNGVMRVAGDRWQIKGPCTYYPKPECKMVGDVDPTVILENTALHLRAKIDLVDQNGTQRVTGLWYFDFNFRLEKSIHTRTTFDVDVFVYDT